jgi:hypothetical protein
MSREWSFLGGALTVVCVVGQFAYGIRHGGAERDVSSTRVHVNAFPYSYGSSYVWLKPGERIAVHYKVTIASGSSEIYVNDSSPWHMGNELYSHLSLPNSGEGTWYPDARPGWNHVLLSERNGGRFDRHVEYTVKWRVE